MRTFDRVESTGIFIKNSFKNIAQPTPHTLLPHCTNIILFLFMEEEKKLIYNNSICNVSPFPYQFHENSISIMRSEIKLFVINILNHSFVQFVCEW